MWRGLESFDTSSASENAPMRALGRKGANRVGEQVVGDELVTAPGEAPHHVRPHSTKTYHSKLHGELQ